MDAAAFMQSWGPLILMTAAFLTAASAYSKWGEVKTMLLEAKADRKEQKERLQGHSDTIHEHTVSLAMIEALPEKVERMRKASALAHRNAEKKLDRLAEQMAERCESCMVKTLAAHQMQHGGEDAEGGD